MDSKNVKRMWLAVLLVIAGVALAQSDARLFSQATEYESQLG